MLSVYAAEIVTYWRSNPELKFVNLSVDFNQLKPCLSQGVKEILIRNSQQ